MALDFLQSRERIWRKAQKTNGKDFFDVFLSNLSVGSMRREHLSFIREQKGKLSSAT